MAFLHTSPDVEAQRAKRFSLLLLEHGETYLEDFGVNFYPHGCSDAEAVRKCIKGRLKLCSRSLILDPQDLSLPLMKFSFAKCSKIDKWESPLLSPIKGDVLVVVAQEYVKMLADNIVKPYEFVRLPSPAPFRFSPLYASSSQFLARVKRLYDAHQLPPRLAAPALEGLCAEAQHALPFNTTWIEDFSEKIVLETVGDLVVPLVRNRGRVVLTNRRIYFQPFNNVDSEPVKKYRLGDITRVVPRRYQLRDVGAELFLGTQHRLYLAFASTERRDEFCTVLRQQPGLQLQCDDQVNVMLAWQCGALSTFDYLMYLNAMADRSFNDLAQYPVFPWVLSDYTSPTLSLSSPLSFRDLSRPVGALNEDRLAQFQARYRDMPDPKFLYGSHYSTPGYVLFYTIRIAPEYSLCLQNGRYDHADRLFTDIGDTWKNCLNGASDVKELIPEFYMEGGDFLLNKLGLDLGTCQDGSKVGHVRLPPWASSAADFTRKCREALESEHVSASIHQWIDLIFGYKQLGPEAVRANNVFYHLTYEGAVDLDKIADPLERQALETQIMEFGQTPKQLFTLPHPQRRVGPPLLPGISSPAFPRADSMRTDPRTPGGRALSPPTPGSALGAASAARRVSSNGTAGAFSSGSGSSGGGVVGGVGVGVGVGGGDVDGSSAAPRTEEESALDGSASAAGSAGAGAAPTSPGAGAGTSTAELYGGVALARLQFKRSNKVHRGEVTAVALDEDSGTVYSVGKDSCLKLHALADDRQLHSVQVGDLALSSCQPSPSGKTVVLGSWDNSIYFYSIEYGRVADQWSGHDDAVSRVCMAGDVLLTASWDSSIKVWRYSGDGGRGRGEELLHDLTEHDGEVTALAVHAGAKLFASGGADGKVVVWSLETFRPRHSFAAHGEGVTAVCFSDDGRRLASCSTDGLLRVFDVELLRQVYSSDALGPLLCLAYDGQFVVGGTKAGALVVWDLVAGQCVFKEVRHAGAVNCLAVGAGGRMVVTGGDDRCYAIWEVA